MDVKLLVDAWAPLPTVEKQAEMQNRDCSSMKAYAFEIHFLTPHIDCMYRSKIVDRIHACRMTSFRSMRIRPKIQRAMPSRKIAKSSN